MKDVMKYAFIWLMGYYVGFCEVKYKTIKALLDTYERLNEEDNKKVEES